MPVVLRHKGYRFFFYADEGNPREPPHVHVRRDDPEAKFWLQPEVSLCYNDGIGTSDMRTITAVVHRERGRLERAWNGFFA